MVCLQQALHTGVSVGECRAAVDLGFESAPMAADAGAAPSSPESYSAAMLTLEGVRSLQAFLNPSVGHMPRAVLRPEEGEGVLKEG